MFGGARLIERRQHDHRHGRERGIGLQLPAELPAVHDRHHQVEQDDVGRVGVLCRYSSASRPFATVAAS